MPVVVQAGKVPCRACSTTGRASACRGSPLSNAPMKTPASINTAPGRVSVTAIDGILPPYWNMALEYGERFQAWSRLDHHLCPIGQKDGHRHALIRDLLEELLQRLSFQCLKRHGL